MPSAKTLIRVLLAAVLLLGFLVFLAPVFTNILNTGNIAGMAVCLALLALTAFWNRLAALIRVSPVLRKIALFAAVIAAALAVLAAVISFFMIKAADSPPKEECTVIVLGCKVRGESPSLMLHYRAMTACSYLRENPGAMCIASGGQGADELISEAECIRRILVENGIDGDRIILEDKSTNTDENIRFSLQKMEEYGITGSAALATNEFHQLRAHMIAEKYGLESFSLSSRTTPYLLPTYWVREWLGVCYQIIRG